MHLEWAILDVYVVIQRFASFKIAILLTTYYARLLSQEERLALGGHATFWKL